MIFGKSLRHQLALVVLFGVSAVSAHIFHDPHAQAPDSMIPWSWRVEDSNHLAKCPSRVSVLGVFFCVNMVVLAFMPIVGRRSVVNKLSYGIFGNNNHHYWITIPLNIMVQIIANVINAALIKNTPGYEQVPIGSLVLIWFTRPRMAWSSIVLVLWRSDEYDSTALSQGYSELFLQALSAFYFLWTVNHGRELGFYKRGGLFGIHDYGKGPRLMYAGALIWLIGIVFVISAITWSLSSIKDSISDRWEKDKRRGCRNWVSTMGFVLIVVIFMIPTLISQWLFWGGVVMTFGDRYCPPKLMQQGIVWGVSSIVGLVTGAVG